MTSPPPVTTLFPYTTLFRSDVIVTTRNDYISNQLAYLSLDRRCGVEVRRAADLESGRSEEHTSELQSLTNIVCRLLLEKKIGSTLPIGSVHIKCIAWKLRRP